MSCCNDGACQSSAPLSPTNIALETATAVTDSRKAAPKELLNIVKFLKDKKKSDLKIREGVLNGNRAEYCKGKHCIASLSLATIPTSSYSTPSDIINALLSYNLLLRVTKSPKSKLLNISPLQSFDSSDYYVFCTPPSTLTYVYSILLVLIVLAGVMFPLWPENMRVGVWYVSMGSFGLLGLLMVISVIRLIVFVVTMMVGTGVWIFPNLYADVSIVDSFKPFWDWHISEKELRERKVAKKAKLKDGKRGKSSNTGKKRKEKSSDVVSDS